MRATRRSGKFFSRMLSICSVPWPTKYKNSLSQNGQTFGVGVEVIAVVTGDLILAAMIGERDVAVDAPQRLAAAPAENER